MSHWQPDVILEPDMVWVSVTPGIFRIQQGEEKRIETWVQCCDGRCAHPHAVCVKVEVAE